MVIVRNDFPEFNDIAEDIDREYCYVNVSIIREPENGELCNRCGEIHIPHTNDRVFFGGALTHEIGHSFYDPVTLFNHIKCLAKVKSELNVSEEEALKLGYAISDILTDFGISKNDKLRNYRREYLIKMFKEWFDENNPITALLWAYYDKIHNCKLNFNKRVFGKYVNAIINVLNSTNDREVRYVEIARILSNLINKIKKKKKSIDLSGLPNDLPIKPDKEELEKTINQIFKDSKDLDEAKNMLKILSCAVKDAQPIVRSEFTMLKKFYQEKANMIRSFIEYPKTVEYRGIKLGSRKWLMSDGLKNLDVKRTILKSGVNIPLVTSKTARILDKFISNRESSKPVDIVISIDVSGSTDYPSGTMTTVSDYEVVMLYALIDEAKRINQRVGLTLWSYEIVYTSLPETYDYREVEKLKDIPLNGYWAGGNTHIIYALEQAEEYSDKLFLIFTDGDVYPNELKYVDNAVFFLIKPKDYKYDMFVKKYGEHRVVRIDDIANIPRVTLKWYRGVFS